MRWVNQNIFYADFEHVSKIYMDGFIAYQKINGAFERSGSFCFVRYGLVILVVTTVIVMGVFCGYILLFICF